MIPHTTYLLLQYQRFSKSCSKVYLQNPYFAKFYLKLNLKKKCFCVYSVLSNTKSKYNYYFVFQTVVILLTKVTFNSHLGDMIKVKLEVKLTNYHYVKTQNISYFYILGILSQISNSHLILWEDALFIIKKWFFIIKAGFYTIPKNILYFY